MNLFPALDPAIQAVVFRDFEATENRDIPVLDEQQALVVAQQRLAAVALRMIDAGTLKAPTDVIETLRDVSFTSTAFALEVIATSMPALKELQERRIPFAISKGPGIAIANSNRNERPFSDLDVLVAPQDFRQTVRMLTRLGYDERVESRPPWKWFNSYCREALNLRHPDGGSIDVHHHVPPWLWTQHVSMQEIIARSALTRFGIYEFPLVSNAVNLLISALHIVSDHNKPGSTLMAWRDLLILARSTEPAEVVALALQFDVAGWLAWILSELPASVRPAALWNEVSMLDARLPYKRRLSRLLPPKLASRHMIGQAFRLPAPNALLYLGGMVLPSKSFLVDHFGEEQHHYLRWWRTSFQGVWAQ